MSIPEHDDRFEFVGVRKNHDELSTLSGFEVMEILNDDFYIFRIDDEKELFELPEIGESWTE